MPFVDSLLGGRVVEQGMFPIKVTLTDTCEPGDLIGFDAVTSNAWKRADANGKIFAELIAGERSEVSGKVVNCYKAAVISGITGVDGDLVYLSDTVGEYAATPSSYWPQAVGKCISTSVAASAGVAEVIGKMYVTPSAMPVAVYDGTGTGFAGFFRSELEAGRSASGHSGGLYVQSKVLDGTTITADLYGIYVFVQWQDTDCGTATSAMIRLEDGCSANCHPDTFITFIPGSVGPDYMFDFGSLSAPSGGCFADSGTAKTGDGGFIKIKTNGGTRYINMYTG